MFSFLRRRLRDSPAEPIDDLAWTAALRASPVLAGLDPRDEAQLRALSARLLATKSFTGVAGLELDGGMRLCIAAQACLPILRLGLHWYDGWSGIVVYPGRFRVHRRLTGDDGTVHESLDELAGEAWDGGPVVLSWADVQDEAVAMGSSPAANVVLHEFAHKLDLLDGVADGIPPFDRRLHRGLTRDHWQQVLEDSLERLRAGLDIVEQSIPPDVDPESPAADPYYARLALDPYAATDEAEFFAVSSEAYFVDGGALEDAFPQWHALLHSFYRPAHAARA